MGIMGISFGLLVVGSALIVMSQRKGQADKLKKGFRGAGIALAAIAVMGLMYSYQSKREAAGAYPGQMPMQMQPQMQMQPR